MMKRKDEEPDDHRDDRPDETDHLLRSPENARRIMEALREIRSGRGRRMSIEELRKEVGLP